MRVSAGHAGPVASLARPRPGLQARWGRVDRVRVPADARPRCLWCEQGESRGPGGAGLVPAGGPNGRV